jgi:UDP-glucose 4-epimerase
MNYLVTGGAGFIGSHLVEKLLNKGHKVIVIDNLSTGKKSNLKNVLNNKKFKFIKMNIVDRSINKYFKNIDVVIHLAAIAEIVPSIDHPEDYFNTNVIGTLRVLEAIKSNNVKKIIYSASSSCYGIPKKYPTSENEIVDPQYPYAFTKLQGESLIVHWSKIYKFDYISLRFFNVYGPRSRTSGTYGAVFGVFLAQKLNNKPFTVVGNGRQKRDFTFVSDIVDSIIIASKSNIKNQIFNVGSGHCYTINYLVKLLKGKKIKIPKRPGEPNITHSNINKIKKELKWEPKVSFEEGVKIILDNISYWNDAPVWTKRRIEKATSKWFKYLS